MEPGQRSNQSLGNAIAEGGTEDPGELPTLQARPEAGMATLTLLTYSPNTVPEWPAGTLLF